MFIWNGKLRNRGWVQSIADGISQIYTRVLGTTVVLPSSPRVLFAVASRSTALSVSASRQTAFSVLASEA